jgi:HlyD family secretion protein
LSAIALAVLALMAWAFMPTPMPVEVATVTEGRFERAVQEDGKTRVRERYTVSAPLAGRVARIHLKQGDAVVRDTLLAVLWPLAPAMLDERARAEQTSRIGAMQALVARARANVERTSAALAQARADLTRSEALVQQGFVSSSQNETGRLNLRLREKEHESAQQEENAARHELAQSRVALHQFTQPLQGGKQRAFEVKAPVAGKVLRVLLPSEGVVTAGTPLLELGDPSHMEVVVDILTEDAAQIKPGAAVQLANWGGTDALEGQVRLIEPAASTKVSALGVDEQRVNAIIDITTTPDKWQTLGDGFKIDVRVLVQVVENAIKVPVSALFPVGARSALFVMDKGHARLQEIDVAGRNGVDAWVRTGLAKGTQVIVYPDTKLEDGAAVKAR